MGIIKNKEIAYNHSIDAVKGILIVLVIVGHLLLGSLDENIIRFIIYSFHMPAFIFISGYLLNVKKLCLLSTRQFVAKYWHRMLKAWVIAWVVYTIAYCFYRGFTLSSIIINITDPYYHLWFVPSLFLLITCSRFLFKTIKDEILSYFILLCLGILFYNISNYWNVSQAYNCRLLPFLILGVFARQYLSNIKIRSAIIYIIYFCLVIVLFFSMNNVMAFFRTYIQLPLCSILLLVFLPLVRKGAWHNTLLELIARNSLQIYLWHVIPIVILKKIWADNYVVYYILSFTILGAFFIGVYFKSRSRVRV